MKPYTTTDSKTAQVRRMFDGLAPRYDLLNHVLSWQIDRLWRRRAVSYAASGSPCRVLDVATGTGDLAFLLASRGFQVTGVDLSPQMLAIATCKAADRKMMGRIAFQEADALHLPFADGSFDAVTVAFGVRNFEDMEAGLAEIHRVLSGDGRLVVLEFSAPQGRIFGVLYRFYFRRILPFVGGWVSKDRAAYAYLQASALAFPEPSRFADLLRQAGFARVAAHSQTGGIAQIYVADKR